jgi:hypothetical protein
VEYAVEVEVGETVNGAVVTTGETVVFLVTHPQASLISSVA